MPTQRRQEKLTRAYEFLVDRESRQEPFSLEELRQASGWSDSTLKAYLSKKLRGILAKSGDAWLCEGVEALGEGGFYRRFSQTADVLRAPLDLAPGGAGDLREAPGAALTGVITHLHLQRFKGFHDADVPLGPLTVVVGVNASGKSNLRDAFRLLHGISRGYSLPEVFGEVRREGELQWRGIRGGTREVVVAGAETFALEVTVALAGNGSATREAHYAIEVGTGGEAVGARVVGERLRLTGPGAKQYEYDSHADMPASRGDGDAMLLPVRVRTRKQGRNPQYDFFAGRPVLTQLEHHPQARRVSSVVESAQAVRAALGGMRFLDPAPEAMREPSVPGQTALGDRGENLSSVLQAICADQQRKVTLIDWLRELTPMDAADLQFRSAWPGRVLLFLRERSGRVISAHSASDGTLRFLAMAAALLGPEPGRFYFIEELENGIHPTRLRLLLELIEARTRTGTVQVVASTHSPQLLGALSPEALGAALVTYRLPQRTALQVKPIRDMPDARRLIAEGRAARMHESGWFEDAAWFSEEDAGA